MDKKQVVRLHASFEDMLQKDPETETEFWFARDLQMLLGYKDWRNFLKVVEKALTACTNSGFDPGNHFVEATKMVVVGFGGQTGGGGHRPHSLCLLSYCPKR